MNVLAEALKKCSNDTDCVASKLKNETKNFQGATGTITIDSDGITRSIKETIHTYENGEIIESKE